MQRLCLKKALFCNSPLRNENIPIQDMHRAYLIQLFFLVPEHHTKLLRIKLDVQRNRVASTALK